MAELLRITAVPEALQSRCKRQAAREMWAVAAVTFMAPLVTQGATQLVQTVALVARSPGGLPAPISGQGIRDNSRFEYQLEAILKNNGSQDASGNSQSVQVTPGCLGYARVSAVRLGNPRLSSPSPKRITPDQARTRLTWPGFTDLNAAAFAGY